MSNLSIQDKQLALTAIEYFISTLKTQAILDESRIDSYEKILEKLKTEIYICTH